MRRIKALPESVPKAFAKGMPRTFPRPYNPRPMRGAMNQTEARYAALLESRRIAGEIISYRFEPITFRLAKATHYTPDFIVTKEDIIEVHEVKGFMREDAWAKLKIAAAMFPEFRFLLCRSKNKKSPWEIIEV